MAGLVPATHVFAAGDCTWWQNRLMGGWVYIMTNRPDGTLYVGSTIDLAKRAWEHREGVAEGFTKKYGLKRLVYVVHFEDIGDAITNEKAMKRWPRTRKVRLIEQANPAWEDLYDRLG